ncbi:MAG: restriction endonuclease [Holophagales bacterium]|jgi:restriction system protein|nr:restriction endonuclease [Holophagales bacterium]
MAIPKYHEIYKEILIALSDGDIHSIDSVRNSVADQKGVTASERTILLDSGTRPVFDDRIGWARTYLKAAGLVDYPRRGFTRITEEGKSVLTANPTLIDNAFLRKYESFCEFNLREKPNASATMKSVINDTQDNTTPTERMGIAFAEINSSLGDEILSEIMSQSPRFFEILVVKLLVKMGYGGALGDNAGQVTPISGDDGIDGFIREDKLGFSNIYIQAKRWNIERTVNRPDIQAFVGAIANKAGKGLFITTASFSDGAKQCARENHVVLIDGNRLTTLMIEYGIGVSTTQTYEIKKLDSDFFTD